MNNQYDLKNGFSNENDIYTDSQDNNTPRKETSAGFDSPINTHRDNGVQDNENSGNQFQHGYYNWQQNQQYAPNPQQYAPNPQQYNPNGQQYAPNPQPYAPNGQSEAQPTPQPMPGYSQGGFAPQSMGGYTPFMPYTVRQRPGFTLPNQNGQAPQSQQGQPAQGGYQPLAQNGGGYPAANTANGVPTPPATP